ncbi:MAG: hypothetical protein J0I41_06075 [Filimonas sp.]|nr:hypothetical protein [Filimonas sp.]
MLPLRQIGSLLSSNQLQEELPHSIDSAKCPAKSFPYTDVILESFATSATTLADASEYFHFASVLPPSHVGEIHTPPPNTIG